MRLGPFDRQLDVGRQDPVTAEANPRTPRTTPRRATRRGMRRARLSLLNASQQEERVAGLVLGAATGTLVTVVPAGRILLAPGQSFEADQAEFYLNIEPYAAGQLHVVVLLDTAAGESGRVLRRAREAHASCDLQTGDVTVWFDDFPVDP